MVSQQSHAHVAELRVENFCMFRTTIHVAIIITVSGCGKTELSRPSDVSLPEPRPSKAHLDADWNQFRGPDQGRAFGTNTLPTVWSESTNVLWKTGTPGTGASSPVLAAGKIWLTSATDNDRSLRALAFDFESGTLLLNKEILLLPSTPPKHRVNNPASPTAFIEHDRIYVSFGSHGIACLSASDGAILWTNTELRFDDEQMGPGASPIVAGDFLVVSCDGTDTRFLAALHKDTGKLVWKTERSNKIAQATPFRKAFSTPILAEIHGIPQIINSSSYRLFSYDPLSGKELWSSEIPGFCPIPVPCVEDGRIYLCTGYNKAELWAFELRKDGSKPSRAWKHTRSVPLISSPVLVGSHLFLVSQEGIASCIDANSGDMLWNERLGGAFWASPLYANGHIFFFAESGATSVVEASTKFNAISKNVLDGEIMATPACGKDSFYLRTKTHLYRIGTAQPTKESAGGTALSNDSAQHQK
jgi:outer membrane protein assembly factor BamB